MDARRELLSYQDLFNDLDFKKGDAARSVYSPAAYLTDLIQMIEDRLEHESDSGEQHDQLALNARRDDIKEIVLNGDSTFDQIPYLDIVNELLRRKIDNPDPDRDIREMLKTTEYPLNLPLDFEYERLKKFLGFLDIREDSLQDLFSLTVDLDSRSRQLLGLSVEEGEYILKDQSAEETALKLAFNLNEDEELATSLAEVSHFLLATDMDGPQLHDLLFGNLSETALNEQGASEQSLASDFFTNHDLGGFATLDSSEERIVWHRSGQPGAGDNPPPPAWFDRCNRFIRLARKTAVSFVDLGILLRDCCGNQLNRETLQILAVIKEIHVKHDVPIDLICALSTNVNTVGIGDQKEPLDLFNRIFNQRYAALDQRYVLQSTFIPRDIAHAIEQENARLLSFAGDILDDENKTGRNRLQKSLQISESQLSTIIEKFRARQALVPTYKTSVDDTKIELAGLSLIFRTVKFCEMLDISIVELFDIFDLLELDPLIYTSDPFKIRLPFATHERDPFYIFDRAGQRAAGEGIVDVQVSTMSSLWLVQTVSAIVAWMQQHDFTTADLKFIQSGSHANENLSETAHAQAVSRFNQVVQAFLPSALKAEALISEQFDARNARIIHETLLSSKPSLVSSADQRILRFDPDIAPQIADEALNRLGTFSAADFKGLAIADKFNDKLYQNLIIHGFINADGQIAPDKLPVHFDEFTLVTDFSTEKFSTLREDLFRLIYDLYKAELETQLSASAAEQLPDELDITVSLFLSDLEALGLPRVQLLELYDNLFFNNYIDEEGTLTTPAFFADPDNESSFEINAAFSHSVIRPLYTLLQDRVVAYKTTPYALEPAVLESVGLPEADLRELIENLHFNDYIDESLIYLDKEKVAALASKEFKLALQFHPQHKAILAAIQADLATDKARYFIVSKEDTAAAADDMVAQLCFEQLQLDYLTDTKISPVWSDFFATSENSAHFALSGYFGATFAQPVFNQIHTIQQQADRYRFKTQTLTDLDLYDEEAEKLVGDLINLGYIEATGSIPFLQQAYFLNVNNALDFNIDGYEDFNKDIFFALHAIAHELDSGQKEVIATLSRLANAQEEVVFGGLAESFEVEVETLKAIVTHFFYQPAYPTEALLKPILAMAGEGGRINMLKLKHGFGHLYQRMTQFVHLVQLLKLDSGEVEVLLQDQNLVQKFPETLEMPHNMVQFDALLADFDNKIFLFQGARYWSYSARTCELTEEEQPLKTLSPLFADIERIDAAFIDPKGHAWLISGTNYFTRKRESENWEAAQKNWGKIKNNFDSTEQIDAAFTTQEGVTYLFSGEQYVRYSTNSFDMVDPGYPKRIRDNWAQEQTIEGLPEDFAQGIGAAFEDSEGQAYLFQGDKFVQIDRHSANGSTISSERFISELWGNVNNKFADLSALDAAFSHKGSTYLFLDNQVIRYSDHVENHEVTIDEGFPLRLKTLLPELPDEFEYGIDGIFHGADDKFHLFKNNRYVQFSGNIAELDPVTWDSTSEPAGSGISITLEGEGEIAERWGRVRNNIQDGMGIDAAFTGLDGCTYVFSEDQYVRYSGRSYNRVDEGFPRKIAPNWGGLESVAAAFILDGKTYLFSKNNAEYVCYSTNDYTTPDEGFPKPIDQEQWWNLPANLTKAGFSEPDAIFIDADNTRYLLKGNRFIAFDHLQRWWSKPKQIKTKWKGLSGQISAAFTGRDGKTYLFMGEQFVRYSDPTYSKVDDRFPRDISSYWGQVVNQIERTRRIDSALVIDSDITSVDADGNEVTTAVKHTYLFSGNQYVRYANDQYDFVEEGYPRSIQSSLHEEPRFKHAPAPFKSTINAAFADQRHVYLVQGSSLQIIAADAYRHYENFAPQLPSTAFLNDGSLYVESDGGWHQANNPEMETRQQTLELPPALRAVPSAFQSNLDAILQGTDQNTYLFQGQNCFNCSLDRAYPLAEEWGIVHNWITEKSHIDAAFLGSDKRVYLFSGDQFVRYAPEAVVDIETEPRFIDGLPQSIADHWGGLTHVHLAFVRDGVTYLLEKPDELGEFRYISCDNSEYAALHDAQPQIANFDWWGIPERYQEEGFNQVDAVLTDDENLFLIQGKEFIQYNETKDIWSYTKPVDRIWRGLEFNQTSFSSITTAFKSGDGKVYFFSADSFAVSEHDIENLLPTNTISPIHEIREHWGRVENVFTNRGLVDAAFVNEEGATYLFSGDQYVKYSSSDYRFVDFGYPKSIAANLRNEMCFSNLPDTFETEMEALAGDIEDSSVQGIRAVVANKGTTYVFTGQSLHAVSTQLSRTCSLATLGQMKNRILEQQRVDAALLNRDDQVLLFAGDQFFVYSDPTFEYVDEGYPRKIGDLLNPNGGADMQYSGFGYDLDAVLEVSDGETSTIYLFKDNEYIDSGSLTQTNSINSFWGRVRNNFETALASNGSDDAEGEEGVAFETNIAVDTVFSVPDGKTFVFKGDQYIRYSHFDNEYVDEGYPLPIKGNWGNLPSQFEEGIDGGFVFDGKTYLLHDAEHQSEQLQSRNLEEGSEIGGTEYVRYSRADCRLIDNIYPQRVADRWQRWGDFLLADLRIISKYKQLQDQHNGGDYQLTDLLNAKAGQKTTPYQILHEIFGWDVAEVKWLKRHNAFIPHLTLPEDHSQNRLEHRFELETIEKMEQVFNTTARMGMGPSIVFSEIWQTLYGSDSDSDSPGAMKTAADHLYRYLGTKNSEHDWAILKEQIRDELNLLERDIWVPLALAQDRTLTHPKDLFELLLIDVEMGNAARTSKVKEAISAIQLYLHRYLVNLETIEAEETGLEQRQIKRAEFKERWQWLKNYRLWEANRKVFLYPENYIRPELRDTKTPEFKQLEEILLQGELNAETAEAAFSAYLESFGMVGNLKIVGANVYQDKRDKVLVLFGYTRLDPKQYYYRTARFSKPENPATSTELFGEEEVVEDDDLVVWSPWEKVDVTIASDRVFPIQANGRLMVFWIEIEDIEEPEAKFKTKSDNEQTVSEVNTTQKRLRHEARVKYSLLKYNSHWTPAQEIKQRIKLDYEIDAAYCEADEIVTFVGGYCLKTTKERPEGEMRRIEEFEEFKSLPSNFHAGIDAATGFNGKRYLFKGNQCVIQQAGNVSVSKSTRDLIVMPEDEPLLIVGPGVFHVSHEIKRESAQAVSLIEKGVQAAFALPLPKAADETADETRRNQGNILALVDDGGKYTFFTEKVTGEEITLHPIRDLEAMDLRFPFFQLFMATIVNRSGNFRPADAVFQKDSIFYVLRDGQYECYDDVGSELIPLDGFPKPIRGNLSFNMDMFFNKLHLQNTLYGDSATVGGDRPLYITYTSPKDRLMLYGKLKPDFTFEEIPHEEDQALTAVLNSKTLLQSYPANDSLIHSGKIKDQSRELKKNVEAMQDRVNGLHVLKEGVKTLQEALDIGRDLLNFAPQEDAPDASPDQIMKSLESSIESLRDRNFNSSVLEEEKNNLLVFVDELLTRLSEFHRATGEDRDELKNKASEIIDEGSELRKGLDNKINKEITSIKTEIGDKHKALQNIITDSVISGRTYLNYLDKIVRTIQIWNDRIGTDNTGVDQESGIGIITEHQDKFKTLNNDLINSANKALEKLAEFPQRQSLKTMTEILTSAGSELARIPDQIDDRASHLAGDEIANTVARLARHAREALLGTFDLFPINFGIANTTNFAFSEPNRPDWHIFEARDGTFLCRPLSDDDESTYEIVRLTTSVIPSLSRILFAQGVMGFLSADTQRVDETPAFVGALETLGNGSATENIIRFSAEPFASVPESSNLDFDGASGIYYSELFFHAPYLIAQALNNAQKFDEAKSWYERIFDPTLVAGTPGAPWQYLPFQERSGAGDFLVDRNQIQRHLDDPFDPHAIAALRPTAYRKAIVMSYIDNLLDWGDMLFRQYSVESINEARMLYILAHDLLGDKPENLGTLRLTEEQPLKQLANTDAYDFVIAPNGVDSGHALIGQAPITVIGDSPNRSVGNPYFFVPENSLFGEYWSRIDDRLYKIRHSLNIDGEAQPLALFQPPIDPMSIVQSVASGVSLSQLMTGASVQVPHYRFEFMIYRAQNLVQKLNQYGNELLATLEKKDAEALSLMQNRQEGQIQKMMIDIRIAQIQEADQTILNLEENQQHAKERIDLYAKWLGDGKLPEEIHQINLMISAAASHYAGSLLKLGSLIAHLFPNATVGPFSMGVTVGGSNAGESISSGAELAESLGEGLSVTGEILATEAQIKHMFEDWDVQLMVAESEHRQIGHQLEGARIQKMVAQYELAVLRKEIENNESIQTFMQEKFSNQKLYQWMIGKMSGLYFQTYQMAFDMAKMAEKSYQFERGLEEKDVSFVQGGYWDSRHKGLLAGEQLALDLDRMEQDFVVSNERRMEITKEVSLLELNPLAFLRLKQNGSCEFSLDEAFFDYDFPGHYARQIKTIEVKFDVPEGTTVNATLTQLSHQTVMQPDPKAVKFLLDPKDQPPATIRSDWRGNQQIVLSHHDQYEKNNGMFELRYDTDYYLPFEGTGAVSRWRLELNGKQGSLDLRSLVDATVAVQYTARQGGSVFAGSVKGLLKPYQTVRFFDMTYDFANEWNDFLDGDEAELALLFTRDRFPNMSSSKISGIFTHIEMTEAEEASMRLNGVDEWTLSQNSYVETNGLSIASKGSALHFEYQGNKEKLRNVQFVFGYKAGVG